MSRFDDAQAHFEQAFEMNVRLRAGLWVARGQYNHACMLLQRGRKGDEARAVQLATDSLTAAEKLGLSALADRARSLPLRS
jgi:hypothetical protein